LLNAMMAVKETNIPIAQRNRAFCSTFVLNIMTFSPLHLCLTPGITWTKSRKVFGIRVHAFVGRC